MPQSSSTVCQGTVVLVQEHRFRLQDDAGHQDLFVVAPHVPVGVGDLRTWLDAGARIEVHSHPSSISRARVATIVRPTRDE